MHKANRTLSKNRLAFTMIEIVLVIVILGIVSMISANIIAHMYDGFMRTKLLNELEAKTEMAIEQIALRLQYRIKDSAIARDMNNINSIKSLSASDMNASFGMMEWIGYDNASLIGESNMTSIASIPGWSGLVDLERPDSNKTQIVTPGSHLKFAERTIHALSYGEINITVPTAGNGAAIIFKCWNNLEPSFYGWDYTTTDHNSTLRIQSVGNNILKFTEDVNAKKLCEQYFLSWTAYALVPEGSSNDFNLTLYYNYQPWYGEKYSDDTTKRSILAEHVSTFRFVQVGSTIRIKLCMHDGNQMSTGMGICKEKAVF